MNLEQLHIGNAAGDVKTLEDVERLAAVPTITRIVVGSITVEERPGNTGTTFWLAPNGQFALNARGLPCRGIQYYRESGNYMADATRARGKELVVSIAGTQHHDDWKRLSECAATFADGVEVNISCPNKWKDGKREGLVADDPDAVYAILNDVFGCVPDDFRVALKIPPFTAKGGGTELFSTLISVLRGYHNKRLEVVSCNTIGGVSTPVIGGKMVLDVPQCGKSGPVLKPFSIGQVERLRSELPQVPIVGVGGIRTGADVREYLDAGASSVQVGTHFFVHGNRVFEEIVSELMT